MNVRRVVVVCLVACGVVMSALAADAPAKVELKLAKGDAFAYTVTSASTRESKGGQNEGKSANSSEVKYLIKVTDKKDNGDLVLAVTYASVKIKDEGGQGAFEFDSAKPTGAAENANLEKAVKSTLTVTVSGNKVKGDITGFPEVARPEAAKDDAEKGKRGAGGMRGGFGRGMGTVSQFGLMRDIAYILSSPIQGVALEKGKAYQTPRPEPVASDDKSKSTRGRMGGGTNLEYTYQGNDAAAAKFDVARKAPQATAGGPGGQGGGPGGMGEAKGTALVSLKDGLLQKIELKSESERTSDRQGTSVTTKSASTTTVVRTPVKKT